MAAVRDKPMVGAVGSADWITQERQQLSQFFEQEQEDFVFSVRNETEWLNEHMADVFSNKQLNIAEVFKTPGKLRGKTPRTARKRSPERAPLTEIFSADRRYNSPSRVQGSAKGAKVASPFQDPIPIEQQFPPIAKSLRPQHDSGYHGSTEDDMEIDEIQPIDTDAAVERPPGREQGAAVIERVSTEERSTTDRSFQSAPENLTTHDLAMSDVTDIPATTIATIPGAFPKEPSLPPLPSEEPQKTINAPSQEAIVEEETTEQPNSPRSSSFGSSPAKPLIRKSSLNFATLPAREPLGTKKSIGNQTSRNSNADGSKGTLNRSSYLGRYTGGKSSGGAKAAEDDNMDIDKQKEPETILHNKDSTQRLHDRINLLTKTQPSRTTKSIPSTTAPTIAAQSLYPIAAQESTAEVNLTEKKEKKEGKSVKIVTAEPSVAEDDDWIMPSTSTANAPERPTLTKSRSVDVMEYITDKDNISDLEFGLVPGANEQARIQSPLRYQSTAYQSPTKVNIKAASTVDLSTTAFQLSAHQKAISVSNPEFPHKLESTTPAGSPTGSKFHLDGLSASKHKLQSIMKSARGLFSSSAKVSNQAKMETMSPSGKLGNKEAPSEAAGAAEHPVYPTLPATNSERPESPGKGRKTRSSTEREKELKRQEKEAKERQKQDNDLTKAREQERQKVAKFQEKLKSAPSAASLIASSLEQTSKPVRSSPRRLPAVDKPLPPINSKVEATAAPTRPTSKLAQSSKTLQPPRRPVRPAVNKDNTLPRTQQPPVSIRIGPLSSRPPMSGPVASSSAASVSEESAPPATAKTTAAMKKASTISQQTNASTASLKSSVSSSSSRAKAPITRKIERKPTAQEVAQQRIAERTAAAEEAKKAAYKQAAEKKNSTAKEQPQAFSRSVHNGKQPLASSSMKPLPKVNPMAEFPRPPTAMSSTQGKRVLDETDDDTPQPIRVGAAHNYQQNDAKRRRTGEEDLVVAEPPLVRPAMAPPIRHSNIRKDPLKSSLFGGNYPMAPPPATMHAASSRPVAPAQAMPQSNGPPRNGPIDMAKFADGRIPFANQPNPPQQAPFKTPLHKQTNTLQAPGSTVFSPMYPNPENIHLAEIETSDDDDDSENERERKRNMPSWTATPNMNAILLQQETIDTDAVFGTIAPPNLEEWFPKDKNRLNKLRARTSSANWFGADRLTEDEVKKDLEARQKMSKDGGWSMGLSRLNE